MLKASVMHTECKMKATILSEWFQSIYTRASSNKILQRISKAHTLMDNFTITVGAIQQLLEGVKTTWQHLLPNSERMSFELAAVITHQFTLFFDTDIYDAWIRPSQLSTSRHEYSMYSYIKSRLIVVKRSKNEILYWLNRVFAAKTRDLYTKKRYFENDYYRE